MNKGDEILEGLKILRKYGELEIAAQHDVLYAGTTEPLGMSKQDVDAIESCGWHFDDEFDSWSIFT